MSNKKKKKQMETLVQLAKELEAQEQAINRESRLLEEQQLELAQRERSIAAAEAAMPGHTDQVSEAESIHFIHREKAADALLSPPEVPSKPTDNEPAPDTLSDEIIQEIQNILKTIFLEYSSSVHQISSQISTVTASTMCAAVACVLDNRSFDAKEVFLQEMHRILRGDAPIAPCGQSSGESPAYKAEPVSHVITKENIHAASEPAPVSTELQTGPSDDNDDDVETMPYESAAPPPDRDDILRISSVFEFQKLGEHGLRNDDTIIRVELPKGIQYIPRNFFYDCSNLKEVWLPDSLLEIGPYSFYGCRSLETVHIGESSALQEIGEYAFAMCESLTSFSLPSQVETLGTSVFRFCSSLEKVYFSQESKLQTIGSHLLQNCTSLKKIHLPDSVTVISTSMFYGCLALYKVVAKGVDTIEDYAFYGDEKLRVVSIGSKKIIASQAFEGCDPTLMIEYLK